MSGAVPKGFQSMSWITIIAYELYEAQVQPLDLSAVWDTKFISISLALPVILAPSVYFERPTV